MKRTPLKRGGPLKRTKRLSPVSKKRRKESAIYLKKRAAFLEAHPFCEVWLQNNGIELVDVPDGLDGTFSIISDGKTKTAPRSTEVHHTAGRTGENYLDESTWMAVSRQAHEWLHAHPREARAKGWLA